MLVTMFDVETGWPAYEPISIDRTPYDELYQAVPHVLVTTSSTESES